MQNPLTALFGFCCALLTAHAVEHTALKVQLNIYSGRPAPVFWITEKETVDEIMDQIQKCPSPEPGESKVRSPRPGYRGFTITPVSTAAQSPSLPAVTIYRSEVEIYRYTGSAEPTIEPRIDVDRRIEQRLITLLEEANLVNVELLDHIKTGNRPKSLPPKRTQP